MVYELQSVYFDKAYHDPDNVRNWLHSFDATPIKRHDTRYYVRYRIRKPSLFSSFITLEMSPGLYLVAGKKIQ